MNCQSFREQILELILPGGEERRRTEMAAHADRCPACAQYLAEMTRTLNTLQPSLEIKATSNFKERVMKKMVETETNTWDRPRARRRWLLRLGVAAAVLIAIGLAALLGNNPKSGNAAWALEQTIKAYQSVRFIHMKFEPVAYGSCGEMWAQFDEQGNLVSMRTEFPDTEDGPKVVVWHEDKAEVWFKKKGTVGIVQEPEMLKRLKMSIDDFDPRLMVENVFAKEAQGEAEIKVEDGKSTNGMLRLLVSYTDLPGKREIYDVDPATRLVTRIEKYRINNGNEELLGRAFFLDYNNPEIAAVFKIEAPEEVVRVDQTAKDVGMVKGNLSDSEMAVKVTRTFFEALIADDYDQGGLIYGGLPGAALKKMLDKKQIKFLRIVSMDDPRPHPIPGTQGIQVPCRIEMEVNGIKTIEEFKIGVRAVHNRPDRWNIFGGF